MNTTDIDALAEIRMRLIYGDIDLDKAKILANPHIDAINEKSREIAKRLNVKPRLVGYKNFIYV